MKEYKTMLLGITVILLGIACRVMIIDRIGPAICEWLGGILPFVGIIITLVGYFSESKKN